jgi:hypothetical protein
MNPHLWALVGFLLAFGVASIVGYFVTHST